MSRRARVNSSLIRQLNIARVFHALRLHPGSSQRELTDITGLDKATVSAVVARLEGDGLLRRRLRDSGGKPGRPEVELLISPTAGALVGARLEPTFIRLIATTLSGERLASLELAGSLDTQQAVELLVGGVARLLDAAGLEPGSVKGLGVGVPALMDDSGKLAFAPNLHWRDVAIREALQERFAFPVYADNDTKAAALAEKLFGACQGMSDFIVINGHSGVGGALYLGGSLYRGAMGYAGELGHTKIRPGGRRCACGARGCLEAYVSESAILARLAEVGLPCRDLFEAARLAGQGEPRALATLGETGEVLGEACADLVNLFNPECIVLGGNYAEVAPFSLARLRESLRRSALEAPLAGCEVIISPLGTESVPMGGVALALEGVLSLPSWLAASEIRGMAG